MVSIIIPSRNEKFLNKTVDGLLDNATGIIEIIVGIDGGTHSLPSRSRIKVIQEPESIGMRPIINKCVEQAQGEYIMKIDAHCLVGKGYDEELSNNCEKNWIVVPRQYSLDEDNWCINKDKRTVDYWYLSSPTLEHEERRLITRGLHGTRWFDYSKRPGTNKPIDDLMSFQGSCYFMSREHFNNIGVMDAASYGNFAYEAVELGMKTWCSGGSVKVNKNTWFAHLHKGKKHGRGYFLSKESVKESAEFCIKMWMNNTWSKSIRDIRWLVDKFGPVPTWENFNWETKW